MATCTSYSKCYPKEAKNTLNTEKQNQTGMVWLSLDQTVHRDCLLSSICSLIVSMMERHRGQRKNIRPDSRAIIIGQTLCQLSVWNKKNHILYLPICTYLCISICSLKNKKITFAHD